MGQDKQTGAGTPAPEWESHYNPADVEAMRDSMGCDKPLFFGLWRVTELYPAADFTGGHTEFPA